MKLFKTNTLAVDGSLDRLTRKFSWKAKGKFKELLQSKPADPTKLLQSEINKPKCVNREWCINDIQPDEGRDLFGRELTIKRWVVIPLEFLFQIQNHQLVVIISRSEV